MAAKRDEGGVKRIEADGRWRRLSRRALEALHWYAVLARGRNEGVVEALLERRGFVAVVPMWRVLRRANRYAKRQIEVRVPVAPGYVLVGFRDDELTAGAPPWHRVFDITMVGSVLGLEDDGQAWQLNGAQVARFLFDNDTRAPVADEADTPHPLVVGQMVTVTHGALAGHVLPVVKIGAGDSVSVLIQLFGRDTEFPVARADVEAHRSGT